MKQISGRHFCKIVERRGWSLDRVKGSHHVYTKPGDPNNLSVPVHGNRPLPTGTLRTLLKTAGLSEADL